jgi:hypothetical protein
MAKLSGEKMKKDGEKMNLEPKKLGGRNHKK